MEPRRGGRAAHRAEPQLLPPQRGEELGDAACRQPGTPTAINCVLTTRSNTLIVSGKRGDPPDLLWEELGKYLLYEMGLGPDRYGLGGRPGAFREPVRAVPEFLGRGLRAHPGEGSRRAAAHRRAVPQLGGQRHRIGAPMGSPGSPSRGCVSSTRSSTTKAQSMG